jgi:hypothetical protein
MFNSFIKFEELNVLDKTVTIVERFSNKTVEVKTGRGRKKREWKGERRSDKEREKKRSRRHAGGGRENQAEEGREEAGGGGTRLSRRGFLPRIL